MRAHTPTPGAHATRRGRLDFARGVLLCRRQENVVLRYLTFVDRMYYGLSDRAIRLQQEATGIRQAAMSLFRPTRTGDLFLQHAAALEAASGAVAARAPARGARAFPRRAVGQVRAALVQRPTGSQQADLIADRLKPGRDFRAERAWHLRHRAEDRYRDKLRERRVQSPRDTGSHCPLSCRGRAAMTAHSSAITEEHTTLEATMLSAAK